MKKKMKKNSYAQAKTLFELDAMFSAACVYLIRQASQQLEADNLITLMKSVADDYEQREREIKTQGRKKK